jgi:hypothetical protein
MSFVSEKRERSPVSGAANRVFKHPRPDAESNGDGIDSESDSDSGNNAHRINVTAANVKHLPRSLDASVSPPPRFRSRKTPLRVNDATLPDAIHRQTMTAQTVHPESVVNVSLAAVESGEIAISDHLAVFAARLRVAVAKRDPQQPHATPLLSISAWTTLYRRHQHAAGHHFVVHQHDHPVAGPHYDLRLQCSSDSALSWAIMYGLPGDPNSRRLNRNAVETRVHCLWVCSLLGLPSSLLQYFSSILCSYFSSVTL